MTNMKKNHRNAKWVRAPELGMRELTALPSDVRDQTGENRFAAEDVDQGALGDCWLIRWVVRVV